MPTDEILQSPTVPPLSEAPQQTPKLHGSCTLFESIAILSGMPEEVAQRYGVSPGDHGNGKAQHALDVMYPTLSGLPGTERFKGMTEADLQAPMAEYNSDFSARRKVGRERLDEAVRNDTAPAYNGDGRLPADFWMTRNLDSQDVQLLRWQRSDLQRVLHLAAASEVNAQTSERHWRFWLQWEDRRRTDRKWTPLSVLAEYRARKDAGRLDHDDARKIAWRLIYDSILAGEFVERGKSQVLLVQAGKTCWRMTREILKDSLPGDRDSQIRGYLPLCWIPTRFAVRWLAAFGIELPDSLLPAPPAQAASAKARAAATAGSESRDPPAAPNVPSPHPKGRPERGGVPREFDREPFADEFWRFVTEFPSASKIKINSHLIAWSKTNYRRPDHFAPPSAQWCRDRTRELAASFRQKRQEPGS